MSKPFTYTVINNETFFQDKNAEPPTLYKICTKHNLGFKNVDDICPYCSMKKRTIVDDWEPSIEQKIDESNLYPILECVEHQQFYIKGLTKCLFCSIEDIPDDDLSELKKDLMRKAMNEKAEW